MRRPAHDGGLDIKSRTFELRRDGDIVRRFVEFELPRSLEILCFMDPFLVPSLVRLCNRCICALQMGLETTSLQRGTEEKQSSTGASTTKARAEPHQSHTKRLLGAKQCKEP
jgi:hypothetical protein